MTSFPRLLLGSALGLALGLGAGCSGDVGAGGPDDGTDENGPSVPGQPGDYVPPTCAQVAVNVAPVVPTVTLLIDQSGSMTENFSGVERWTAVYRTLMEPTTGVVKKLESSVRFGLALYSSNGGNAGGQCPQLAEVGHALNNFAAIDTVFGPARPASDTPTGPSLTAAAQDLLLVTEPGPKVIVLATDGAPDTCTDANPATTARQNAAYAETVAAAKAIFDTYGIMVYVISVGNDVTAAHLQQMANVGVGLPATGGGNAPYYLALDSAQLVNAFEGIVRGVRSCRYELDGAIELDLAQDGTVTMDGAELTYGTDWQLIDASTLELLGASCEAFLAGGTHEVAATFPCGAVIL